MKILTEKNFEHLGYNDRDMINWLRVIKNIPAVARDLTKIEEQLLLWKDGPCVTPNKESIQSKNNPLLVNFYLTICYFIQLMETKEDEVYDIVYKVKKFREETNKISDHNIIKSRARVTEWLHEHGSGFKCLKSGKQKKEEMLRLKGSVVCSSWKEAYQHTNQKFPQISWKGLTIFFDPNDTEHRFKRDDQVEFSVGFNYKGPRAIDCSPIPNMQPRKTTENHHDDWPHDPFFS